MADEREQEMLELMGTIESYIVEAKLAATQTLYKINQLQNTVNEIWAEWTRTHGLKGGVSQPKPAEVEDAHAAAYGGDVGPRPERKVKRTIRA